MKQEWVGKRGGIEEIRKEEKKSKGKDLTTQSYLVP